MASEAPFACDTMALEQWLQFIFLPRMTELVSTGAPLPSAIAVAPMAEYVWQQEPKMLQTIAILKEIDALLGGQEA